MSSLRSASLLGVTAAALSLVAPVGSCAVVLADTTGGTSPAAAAGSVPLDATDVGGTQAPEGQGTGGSEYGIVPSSSHGRSAHAPARRVTSHTTHRPRRPSRARRPAPKPRPPAPKAVPAPPAGQAPGVPTPAQTVAAGAVFPVRGPHSFGGPENRFGAGRAGHVHEGQDVLAAEGLPDAAPLAGTVLTTGFQAGGAGWYVVEHTAGPFDFFFAHCRSGSIQVSTGQVVPAGQTLCQVGQTGDATGPHLHFEMWVGGWQAPGGHPIDPLPYLQAWEAG
jgi:murein DD-endopeptidase MepM/ murein hydrolase activator NlpD